MFSKCDTLENCFFQSSSIHVHNVLCMHNLYQTTPLGASHHLHRENRTYTLKRSIWAKKVYKKNNISQLWSKTQVDNMKTRIVSGKQSWEVFKMKILHQSWRKKAGLNERLVGCNHEEIYYFWPMLICVTCSCSTNTTQLAVINKWIAGKQHTAKCLWNAFGPLQRIEKR